MACFSGLPAEMAQRIAEMADTPSILAVRLVNKETERRVFATFVIRCLEDLRIGGSQLAIERAIEFLTAIKSVESSIGKRAVTFVSSDRYLGLKGNNKCTVRAQHIQALFDLIPTFKCLTLRNDTVAMPRATDTWDGGVTIDPKDPWLKQREIKTYHFDTEVVEALSNSNLLWLTDLTLEGVTIESFSLHNAITHLDSIEYVSIRHVDLEWGCFTAILKDIHEYWAGDLKRFIIDSVFDRASGRYEYSVVPLDTLVQLTGKREEYTWSAPTGIGPDGEEEDEMQEVWLWRTRGSMKGRVGVLKGIEIMLHGR